MKIEQQEQSLIGRSVIKHNNLSKKVVYKPQRNHKQNLELKKKQSGASEFYSFLKKNLSRYGAYGSQSLSLKIQWTQLVVEILQTTSYNELQWSFLSTRRKRLLNEFGKVLQEFYVMLNGRMI